MNKIMSPDMEINEYNTEAFIQEIAQRSLIWSSVSLSPNDKTKRSDAWEEVCTIFCPEFRKLSEEERKEIRTTYQKRWINLRDCYVKDKKKRLQGLSNYKQYKYFDLLRFLDTVVKHRDRKVVYGSEGDGCYQFQDERADIKRNRNSREGSTLVNKRRKQSNETITIDLDEEDSVPDERDGEVVYVRYQSEDGSEGGRQSKSAGNCDFDCGEGSVKTEDERRFNEYNLSIMDQYQRNFHATKHEQYDKHSSDTDSKKVETIVTPDIRFYKHTSSSGDEETDSYSNDRHRSSAQPSSSRNSSEAYFNPFTNFNFPNSTTKNEHLEAPSSFEDDRLFLMSLTKDLNKIGDAFKLEAKSDIIGVIRKWQRAQALYFGNMQSGNG